MLYFFSKMTVEKHRNLKLYQLGFMGEDSRSVGFTLTGDFPIDLRSYRI
jgi:hypothetical protein